MIKEGGQILPIVFVALGVVLFTTLFIIGGAQVYFQNSEYSYQAESATSLAEAGIDKAIASLNKTGGTYNGEAETILGDGSYSTKITTIDTASKAVESTGYLPNKDQPRIKRTIKVIVSRGIGASFVYGVQVGDGGLQLGNSNQVTGSIYSNGSIAAGNNNVITGDAWVAGSTQIIPDQTTDCFGSNCQDFIFGKIVNGDLRLNAAQSFKSTNSGLLNKVTLKLKKNGTPADATVRIMLDKNGKPDKNNVIAIGTLSSGLLASVYGFIEVTFTSSPSLIVDTPYWIMISTTADNNNYFSWQNDLAQGYTNGLPVWSSDWQSGNPTWNNIFGDLSFQIFLVGGANKISGNNSFTVSGNVHANTIANLAIGKDAYYQTLTNTTVTGIKYPNSPDVPPKPFPLSDANITEWKQQAEAASVTNGDISLCSNLHAGKIIGNVTFNSNCNITSGSPIWITGNLTINSNNSIKLEQGFGSISGVIIADGIITLGTNNHVDGSGTGSSVLLLVSTYDSRTTGIPAIQISNSGNVVVLYADKGIIEPGNGNQFEELTAWGIKLINNGIITYDTGLSSSLFSSGPGGSYSLIKGTYQVK